MTTTEHRMVSTAVRSALLLPQLAHLPDLQAKPLREKVAGNLLTTGSNQLRVRDHNQLLVLQAIRTQGPLTRRELAVATGLTFQTVENISKRLIDAGVVKDVPPPTPQGRSRHLVLRPGGAHAIGVCLTSTACEVALCDFDGHIVSTTGRGFDAATDSGYVLSWLGRVVPDLIDGANVPVNTVLGIGLAHSAVSTPIGNRCDLLPAPWPNRLDIERHLRMPTVSSSNVLAAVCGEQWGGQLTARDAIYVHLGESVAGAVVSNGQLGAGATGRCGDIAHLTADPAGPPCTCGRLGCLEALIGANHLRAIAGRAPGSTEPPSITEPPSMTAIAELATTDPAVAAIVHRAAAQLVRALVPAVQLLDPQVMILGGPTADALGEFFRSSVCEQLAAAAPGRHPKVDLARPTAGQAASAATLVLHQVFTPTVDHLLLHTS